MFLKYLTFIFANLAHGVSHVKVLQPRDIVESKVSPKVSMKTGLAEFLAAPFRAATNDYFHSRFIC